MKCRALRGILIAAILFRKKFPQARAGWNDGHHFEIAYGRFTFDVRRTCKGLGPNLEMVWNAARVHMGSTLTLDPEIVRFATRPFSIFRNSAT